MGGSRNQANGRYERGIGNETTTESKGSYKRMRRGTTGPRQERNARINVQTRLQIPTVDRVFQTTEKKKERCRRPINEVGDEGNEKDIQKVPRHGVTLVRRPTPAAVNHARLREREIDRQ